jgi:hypothetical protein
MLTLKDISTQSYAMITSLFTTSKDYILYRVGKWFCTPVAKHVYDIEYMIFFRRFKIRVHSRPGPSPYAAFLTTDHKDVTHMIMPYTGPGYDFHGLHYTPLSFGLEELTLVFTSGVRRTYTRDEVISAPLFCT